MHHAPLCICGELKNAAVGVQLHVMERLRFPLVPQLAERPGVIRSGPLPEFLFMASPALHGDGNFILVPVLAAA